MRRMYSKAQLSAIIDEKLNGYDSAIPTELQQVGDFVYLANNGTLLEDSGIHITQIWHSVQIYSTDAQEFTLAFAFPANDDKVINSIEDFINVFKGKRIPVSGFHVTQLTGAGEIDQAFILMDVGNTIAETYITDAKSSRHKFTDLFGTTNNNVKFIDKVYKI